MKNSKTIAMLFLAATLVISCESKEIEKEVQTEEIQDEQATTDEDTSDLDNDKD